MPEIIEISGIDEKGGGEKNPSMASYSALLALIALGGAILLFGIVIPKLIVGRKEEALGDLGIIRKCRIKDMDPGRPKESQKWCLWDSKGRRILGRHSTPEGAIRQERLIQLRKRGVL